MSALQMFTNDVDYVIAESPEDAATLLRKLYGCLTEDEVGGLYAMAGQLDFRFQNDDGSVETKPVQEWINEKGRGYFASSEC